MDISKERGTGTTEEIIYVILSQKSFVFFKYIII
jgi:hypothetical protein